MVTLSQVKVAIEQQDADWEAGSTSFASRSRASQRRGGGLRLRRNDPAEPSRLERRDRAEQNRDRTPTVGNFPGAFDHRSVDPGGADFTSRVKKQGDCAACVGFGIAATIEATLRRRQQDPNASIDISEAQLFFCYGINPSCASGLDKLVPVLESAVQHGVVREDCCPYDQQKCQLCANPGTQLTSIAGFEAIDDEDEKRRWISTEGPLITVFEMWEDFPFYRSGRYRHVIGNFLTAHCVSVVGYDDTDQCWICQNSQGKNWGEDGFFRIEYGDSGIDARMWGIVPS